MLVFPGKEFTFLIFSLRLSCFIELFFGKKNTYFNFKKVSDLTEDNLTLKTRIVVEK